MPLGATLYRRVLRGIHDAKVAPHHLDDMRFLVDPATFQAICIASQSAVKSPPRKLKAVAGNSADGVNVRVALPDKVVEKTHLAALQLARQEFRNGAPDAAKAFWAIKRLEDIVKNKVPSAGGLLHDDDCAVPKLRHGAYPFASRFMPVERDEQLGEAATAKGAEDQGAVIFVRSRCANNDRGPVRFHLRVSLFNNDATFPLQIVNTQFFAVAVADSPALTEITGAMPLVSMTVPPTQTPNGEQQEPHGHTTRRRSLKNTGTTKELGNVNESSIEPSACDFDVVIPVESTAYIRGVIYYAHIPITESLPNASTSKPGRDQNEETPLRHPYVTEYGILRALHFGPVKLDVDVPHYIRMASS
jgi:hypothetical protein